MACLVRRALCLKLLTNNNIKSLNVNVRHCSVAHRSKIVETANGERIITSCNDNPTFVDTTITEYVWQHVNNHLSKVALECGITGRKYTYAEARDFSNYVARSLINLGFKNGDVLAIVIPNIPEFAIAFLGILEAGILATTINPVYTIDEISRQLTSSGAKGIIASADIADTVIKAAEAVLPPQAPVVIIEYPGYSVPNGTIPFKDLIVRGKTLPPLPSNLMSTDDVAVLPYSSGTTGLPKGVMLTHRNLASNIQMCDQTYQGALFETASNSYQEIIPAVLPLYHMFGLNVVLLPGLRYGAKLVTLPKFTTNDYLKILTEHRSTLLFLVPPIMLFLTASKDCKRRHVESMKRILSGAAPLSDSDAEQFYDKFKVDKNDLKFCQGYGLTETSPVSTLEMSGKNYASIGKNVVGCDLRLVDPMTKKDVSGPHQSGEIWMRGIHIMKGYWNNEKATNETMNNDWFMSGDIAYYDEDLNLYITDRMKDLIKVKGFQVAPAELESLLRSHPVIEEAAVIGVPDPRSGEVPRAFVVVEKGKQLKEEEVQNFIKGKVSEFKELKGGVTFVESIPKNATGKILKKDIRNQYIK